MDFSLVREVDILEGHVMQIEAGNNIIWKRPTKKLPDEYQRLDYITLSGTQSFIYEQKPMVNNMEIQMEFSISEFGSIMYMAGTYRTDKPVHAVLTPVLSGAGSWLNCYSGSEEPGSSFIRTFVTNQKYYF